ncbi:hypothetical protein BN946_scf185001.g17 [Trametes cinnabarina]|uniref:Uncharacterized protein n=1 Tax=Pycnoporus cinnabarinus TaxID=5643 RepID=A0A060SRE0_PYCCI|nr:hypothetical protein BN946_scf185001.g17 [Trametes cinnabarina]
MALPHSLMLALSPTFACRRAPSRLIRDRYYTAARHISSSAALGSPPSSLAGTAPFHTAYVLLHTHDPPAVYPARSKSPTWRHLTLAARQWGSTVNFAWSPDLRVHPQYKGLGEEGAVALSSIPEIYTASVFSIAHRHGRLEIPEVSGQNYQEVSENIQRLVSSSVAVDEGKLDKRLHLFVCTHGSRDCRCGEGGGEVARALRRELQKRGIGAKDVVLGEVAHVGGHKYAANVLVYPYGEWLGTVQEFDVPIILDEILDWHARYQARVSQSGRPSEEMPPLCPPFWRGRMGLDKEEQLALFQRAA